MNAVVDRRTVMSNAVVAVTAPVVAGSAASAIVALPATASPGRASAIVEAPEATELPVTRCARLAAELADALNDYMDGRFHAQVFPSEQHELPVAFTNTAARQRADADAYRIARLAGAYRRAFWDWTAIFQEGQSKGWDAADGDLAQRRDASAKALNEAQAELLLAARGREAMPTW